MRGNSGGDTVFGIGTTPAPINGNTDGLSHRQVGRQEAANESPDERPKERHGVKKRIRFTSQRHFFSFHSHFRKSTALSIQITEHDRISRPVSRGSFLPSSLHLFIPSCLHSIPANTHPTPLQQGPPSWFPPLRHAFSTGSYDSRGEKHSGVCPFPSPLHLRHGF